jgi:hypothetical protein
MAKNEMANHGVSRAGAHETKGDNTQPLASRDTAPTDVPETKQEEIRSKAGTKGRIAGGSFLKDLNDSDPDSPDEGPLKEVDVDKPLTLTETTHKHDQEYIVLKFTDNDKEDPFNWSTGRKAWITLLLCLMTLFIGLATTAYSSGINRCALLSGLHTKYPTQ